MNNDLITREYLRDAFDNLCCHNCKTCRNFRIEDSFYKCALIENAPAITPSFGMFRAMLCETCQAYAMNRAIAKLADEYTRTQGKWILCEDSDFSKCSICGDIWLNEECKNYCPNCGADMRKGGNK